MVFLDVGFELMGTDGSLRIESTFDEVGRAKDSKKKEYIFKRDEVLRIGEDDLRRWFTTADSTCGELARLKLRAHLLDV